MSTTVQPTAAKPSGLSTGGLARAAGRMITGWSLIRAFTVLVYLFMFLPVVVVVLLAFNASQFGSFPMEGFSFRWFVALWNNEAIVRAFKTSLLLGALTGLTSTALGVLASLALVRYDFRGKSLITTALIAPILVPEVVLAVALLLFLRSLDMPKSFPLLLLGHVIFTLPFVVLIVQARLVAVRREYEEAAMSLGANAFHTFREVTLPLIMPAVFAGLIFAFTISFDDITGTLFWKPGGVETVPTQIFAMLRNSISPEINALGAVMVVVTVAVPLAGAAIARRMAAALK
jgi:spermidine/putrescine transport system permease protein